MHDLESFRRMVHEAYPRLHDRAFLERHPLLELFGWQSPFAAERLHRTLIDALEWLRPIGAVAASSVEWRRYRHLQLRYVEGAAPEEIARELQVSPRQARRDHAEALDEIAKFLWARVDESARRSADIQQPIVPEARILPRSASLRADDPLDAEISKLAATTGPMICDVGEVIRGVVETVARLAQANDVRLMVRHPAQSAQVAVSRTVLRQLFLNLLSDAIVHHPEATLEITVGDHGDRVEAEVQFTSSGEAAVSPGSVETPSIEHSDTPIVVSSRVFEMTKRLAESQGAALGIEVINRIPRIRLSLPASRATTLLLVDDNPDVALLFRRYLGGTSYRLIQARSPDRALRLAREQNPDVIILDVLMPAHDGWEILQALHAEPETARIPVVICSVLPDHALAYSLGVTDFLTKPVTRPELFQVLARLGHDPENAARRAPTESSALSHPRAAHPAG